jgi:class 3 adenylate cyclase/pimeloyl-ACP methyl ester carboxylesterase
MLALPVVRFPAMEPLIQYAKTSDGVSIAYYALGEGRPLIVLSPTLTTSILGEWGIPSARRIAEVSSRNFTYIRFDPRGCGLSDRDVTDFSLEAMTRDVEAVADAATNCPFGIFAPGSGGPVGINFAAAHADLVSHLVLWATSARGAERQPAQFRQLVELVRTDWTLATESMNRALDSWANSDLAGQYAAMMREAVTPETYLLYVHAQRNWDASDLLARVRAPTLVLHPKAHAFYPTEPSRKTAAAIPGARFVLVDSPSVFLPDLKVAYISGEFLGVETTPQRTSPEGGTAVILFADIADSTALTERLGDDAFRGKARGLDAALRKAISEAGGTAIEGKVLGDGVLATFASAREAIACAKACHRAGSHIGLPLHVGVHAGDVIREEGNVYGGAVNLAARVAAEAAAAETLVSGTVRDLARTSAGVSFEDRGEHALKGIEEPVRLYEVRWREET